ncbi:MAG: hypothetical protein V4608_10050 [Bacteroidota bacterium]
MKKLVLILCAAIICSSFAPYTIDVYSVIKVIGGIKHASNNKALFTGDKILSNERLTFASNLSKAALVNKEKGRLMLNATASGTVSEGLMPALNNVSSRGGALINSLDLKNHFADKYLILSGYEVEIGDASFPMDEEKFFFLRFMHNGEEISKKLPFENNKLKMDAAEILKVDGKAITLKEGTTAQLVYRNSIDKTSETIASFEPIFADEKNLKNECKLIVYEIGSEKNTEKSREQLLSYLTENYGKPLNSNFNQWLKTNLEM